jgi:CheY-like chemotaxis protein
MELVMVLVVDDDPGVRNVLGCAFADAGIPVHTAASGEEALAIYAEQSHDVSLVLLDVRMPDMDGPQVFAGLRQLGLAAPVVFMSGDTGVYTEDSLLALGASEVLAKPFPSIKALVAMVRYFMARSRSHAK